MAAPLTSTASGPSITGGCDETRVGKPVAQVWIAGKLVLQQRGPIAQRGVTRLRRPDDAHVRQAARHGRHADVAAAADVHLTERGHASDVLVVRADRPASRPLRMARDTQTEGHRRMPAVGRNRHVRAKLVLRPVPTDCDAGDPSSVHERATNRGTSLELRAGGDRLLQQRPIQVAAPERASGQIARIAAFDRHAVLARHAHAVDTQAALFDRRSHIEPAQNRERAGVDGVAAQLLPGECGAIEEPHTCAGARENGCGDRARGSRSDNQDVSDHCSRGPTSLYCAGAPPPARTDADASPRISQSSARHGRRRLLPSLAPGPTHGALAQGCRSLSLARPHRSTISRLPVQGQSHCSSIRSRGNCTARPRSRPRGRGWE